MAGIAIPRFLEATKAARGAKIVADMRTMESAVYVYYAKYGKYPGSEAMSNASFTNLIQGGIPKPPVGAAAIAYTTSKGESGTNEFTVASGASYSYDSSAESDSSKTGFIKYKDKTVVDLITAAGTPSDT